MKRYIVFLLVTALMFGVLNVPAFAEQTSVSSDEITLLAPPSGKLTVVPVQLKNAEGQVEENAEFSVLNQPNGVIMNKNGKLVLNGDEVASGDFIINASSENTTSTIDAKVLPVRYYEDFEDVDVGANANTTRLNNIDGTVSDLSITTDTNTVLVASDGTKKYADTATAGAQLPIDLSAFASNCSRLTIEAMVKRGHNSYPITLKTTGSGTATLRFYSSNAAYWNYSGTTTNLGHTMATSGGAWEKIIIKLDLINGTIDTFIGGIWRAQVVTEDWKGAKPTAINFGLLVDEVAIYSGFTEVTSIEENIPQTVTVSKTRKTEIPFYASVEPFGYAPQITSNVSGVTAENNVLYIEPNTSTGVAALTVEGMQGTDFAVSGNSDVNVVNALEEDFQMQSIGGNIASDGENLYHTGSGSFSVSAEGRAVFEAKVKNSGTITILNDGENIELPITDDGVNWHNIAVLLDDENEEYIVISDNKVVREGEYSGNTVTGISVEGISIDDIYLGNTYESAPRALDVGYLGNALDGNEISAKYRYFSLTNKQKDSCELGWYLSATSDSLGECISTDEQLTIIKEYVGKYLTLAVTVTGGGVEGETVYSTPVLIKDLFTPSITSGGIELEINNPSDDAVYYAFAVLYTGGNLSDICAVKLTEDAGTITRLIPISDSYDGAYVFMTDENFVPAGVMKSVGSVPPVGTPSTESDAFYEKDGKITFAKTPVDQAALFVLKPTEANSFKEAFTTDNLKSVINSVGGSVAEYIAFATVTDSDKVFSHNIESKGYYRVCAVLKSGDEQNFCFSMKLSELFASAELKNANESDFVNILDNFTDVDEETLKKLYTVYKATTNKETTGKFLEAENMDMSLLKIAIYLSAFLENDDYADVLKTALTEKSYSTDGVSLMALNSVFAETVAALPAPCKIVDYLASVKEKAILLGIKNAANYIEVKKYLDAVSESSVSDKMAEDFLGLTFDSISDVVEAIDNYSPAKKKPSSSGSGGGGFGGGITSPGISANIAVSDVNNGNVNTSKFTDINENHWAYENVLKLAERKVIDGYDDGSFMPERNVTRAELVKIICVAFNLTGQGDEFSDVEKDSWFYPYVSSASYNGIIKGDNGIFRPNDLVSREDAALMLWRAAKENDIKFAGGNTTISDLHKVAGYAQDAVKTLNGAGIITGMDDGSYAPKVPLTRAQAATILVRMFAIQ